MHLILSHAASHRWPDTERPRPVLPQLQQLLGGMRRVQALTALEWERPHPLMPHERALAQALGWPDTGPWPWAARDTGTTGPQAWLTPCHWKVGMDQVVMLPPQALALSEEESRQLLQAMHPYMAEDGLQVQWHSPLRWLARGDVLKGVATASLARVSGTHIHPWITDGSLPAPLRRLQSEMQMLLYNHPVNDARMARSQLTVNAFWLHGAGEAATTAPQRPDVRCIQDLEDGVRQGDAPAWQAAWTKIDRELLAPWCQTDTPLTLTLCSETTAHTWRREPQAWHQRLLRRMNPLDTDAILRGLLREPTDS